MWRSLGKVAVAVPGTLARATANETTPAATVSAHKIIFQQIAGQTGKIYICDRSNAVVATGVGILYTLAVPTANLIPEKEITVEYAPGALNAADYWIDAETGTQGCQVSVVEM